MLAATIAAAEAISRAAKRRCGAARTWIGPRPYLRGNRIVDPGYSAARLKVNTPSQPPQPEKTIESYSPIDGNPSIHKNWKML